MSIRLINPATLHPAPGYSHVAESSGKRMVHFAGQVALDREFRIIGDSIHAQTVAAMTNLKAAMDEVGIGWGDIVRRTVFTLHPTEYEAISRAIEEVTGGADNPPQTIIGVTGLAVPGLLIEIECTAVADGSE